MDLARRGTWARSPAVMDVLYAFIKSQELRALIEPTSPRPDAASAIFNLPDYLVTDTEILTLGSAGSESKPLPRPAAPPVV